MHRKGPNGQCYPLYYRLWLAHNSIFYTVLPNRYIGDYVQKKINEDKILKCLTFIASYEEFTDGNSARFSNNRIGEKKANFNHSIIEL